MIRAVVGSSLKFRRLVVAAAAGAVILGIATLPSASVDALPEFSPPYVEIQTEALGLSAEEVEQLITVPLEADLLNGVAWLDSIESTSVTGLSSIVLTFEMGTDPIRARQMVSERLTQAHAIPNVSKPPVMLQPLSSSNRLMMVSLSSEELSLIDMSVLARWTIRPRLMGVQGVANVAIWGQRERQLQVLADPERLQQAGVSLDDVIETTGNALWVSPLTFLEASTPGTGGFIDTPNQRLAVQHRLPIHSAEDLGRVTIETPDGTAGVVRLSDVADVVEDHQPHLDRDFNRGRWARPRCARRDDQRDDGRRVRCRRRRSRGRRDRRNDRSHATTAERQAGRDPVIADLDHPAGHHRREGLDGLRDPRAPDRDGTCPAARRCDRRTLAVAHPRLRRRTAHLDGGLPHGRARSRRHAARHAVCRAPRASPDAVAPERIWRTARPALRPDASRVPRRGHRQRGGGRALRGFDGAGARPRRGAAVRGAGPAHPVGR